MRHRPSLMSSNRSLAKIFTRILNYARLSQQEFVRSTNQNYLFPFFYYQGSSNFAFEVRYSKRELILILCHFNRWVAVHGNFKYFRAPSRKYCGYILVFHRKSRMLRVRRFDWRIKCKHSLSPLILRLLNTSAPESSIVHFVIEINTAVV